MANTKGLDGPKEGTVAFVVGSKRGGVGKTTIATLLADMTAPESLSRVQQAVERQGGRAPYLQEIAAELQDLARENTLIDIDASANTKESTSAFSRRLPNVVRYGVQPSSQDLNSDRTARLRHFDKVGMTMRYLDAIVDLGANVTEGLTAFLRDADMASDLTDEGGRLHFLSVATADRGAIEDALSALADMSEAFQTSPQALAAHLVINDYAGQWGTLAKSDLGEKFEIAKKRYGFGVMRLPNQIDGEIELWAAFDGSQYAPSAILSMVPADAFANFQSALAAFPAPEYSVKRSLRFYGMWYLRALREFKAAGIFLPSRSRK